MSIFGAIWKTAAWIALAIGLYLNGNLDKVEIPPNPIFLTIEEANDPTPLPDRMRDRTEVPCALTLLLPDRSIERFETWLESRPTGETSLSILDDSGRPLDLWSARGNELNYIDSYAEDNVIVAEGTCSTKGGSSFAVKSTVSDSFFLSHRPSIIVGERSDYSNSEIMKQWLKRKDRTPGLLLIIGGAFVFLHVFFVLARLIIPDCEPPEFSVAS